MEQDQPLFSQPQQIDYSTLLSIIKQELKKFSLSNQTFSYQTACRYGPKDHDILAFQVRVLQKILDNIPHDQLAHRSLAELQVKNLALEENMGILKSELNSATSKNAKLAVQLQEAHAAIADKDKKLTSLMRKCDQFDRLGGKQKFDKLDQEFRQITGKLASLQLSEKKASEKLAELQRQIKLQKELNSQQETAIVDLQIQNEGLKERLETIEKSKKQKETTLKENVQSFSNGAKVSDMELLSLKQKIKEQSQLIDSLRSEFETAKSHWLKKQQHYSKVVEKCFMKEQLL